MLAGPELDFGLRTRWPNGETLAVIRPVTQDHRVHVVTTLTFDHQAVADFESLTPERQATVLWDLRLELVRMGVEFVGIESPPRMIFIGYRMLVEGLTRVTFMDHFDRVRRALLATTWIFRRAIEAAPGQIGSFPGTPPPATGFNGGMPEWGKLGLQGMGVGVN